MKLVIINPEIIARPENFVLDLQNMQIEGHRPYPYWTQKYNFSQNSQFFIPENIYACLTGQLTGVMGSQYNLKNYFLEQNTEDINPQKLEKFPSKDEIKGKKVLCILSHCTFGLGDLILSMPFLKLFAEKLEIKLGISVNSAGQEFFFGQDWLYKTHPEIIEEAEFKEYDYYVESAVEKMNVLGWLRSYLLKEFGEEAFYERFPAPKLVTRETKQKNFNQSLNALPNRDTRKRICFLNWETSSQKRNLPLDALKAIYKALCIMDFQILVSRPVHQRNAVFDWLCRQNNVINASNLVEGAKDLINLVNYCDLLVSPDTSFIHFAGGLRKRALCIFLRSATELYEKTWLKGNYWPRKLDLLYPTVNSILIPQGPFKDMEQILYSAVRTAAFGEDPELLEIYNGLFFHLRSQGALKEIQEIFERKTIDFQRLLKEKNKRAEKSEEAVEIKSEI